MQIQEVVHEFDVAQPFIVRVFIYQQKYKANLFIKGENLLFCCGDNKDSFEEAVQSLQKNMDELFKGIDSIAEVVKLENT